MADINIERLFPGCYRVTGTSLYGVVKKHARQWNAEIRRGHDGEIVRFAGTWKSMADAIEECTRIIAREEQ